MTLLLNKIATSIALLNIVIITLLYYDYTAKHPIVLNKYFSHFDCQFNRVSPGSSSYYSCHIHSQNDEMFFLPNKIHFKSDLIKGEVFQIISTPILKRNKALKIDNSRFSITEDISMLSSYKIQLLYGLIILISVSTFLFNNRSLQKTVLIFSFLQICLTIAYFIIY